MSVIWYYSTGLTGAVLSGLKMALSQYARHNDYLKVGITNDPERRWGEHRQDGWHQMVVIYATSSRNNAADVERKLIDFIWASGYQEKVWNDVSGGGGRIPEGGSEYFVYVLLE